VQPNFVSTVLSKAQGELSATDEDLLLWASASLFGGRFSSSFAVHPKLIKLFRRSGHGNGSNANLRG
jgi:hypothetical protein